MLDLHRHCQIITTAHLDNLSFLFQLSFHTKQYIGRSKARKKKKNPKCRGFSTLQKSLSHKDNSIESYYLCMWTKSDKE
jgi:hypothetical protein